MEQLPITDPILAITRFKKKNPGEFDYKASFEFRYGHLVVGNCRLREKRGATYFYGPQLDARDEDNEVVWTFDPLRTIKKSISLALLEQLKLFVDDEGVLGSRFAPKEMEPLPLHIVDYERVPKTDTTYKGRFHVKYGDLDVWDFSHYAESSWEFPIARVQGKESLWPFTNTPNAFRVQMNEVFTAYMRSKP